MVKKKDKSLKLVSQVDYKIYTEYCNFHTIKVEKLDRLGLIYVLGIVLILFLYKINVNVTYYIYIYIGLAIFCILLFLVRNYEMKKYYKSAEDLLNSETVYEFNDNDLYVCDKYGQSRLPYDNFYKVMETNTALYIYITNKQSFIIDKKQNDLDTLVKVTVLLQKNTNYESYVK